ncbi:unnamed protein product [Owenia fusiformis]|uniref:NR LBD domain-containing protein n=1 Tax=Owenia fusiformis TaxID=6347 RepID=A0A8S4N526_OWEFU|nr:unnamed protein product [Owenia fusiformis]
MALLLLCKDSADIRQQLAPTKGKQDSCDCGCSEGPPILQTLLQPGASFSSSCTKSSEVPHQQNNTSKLFNILQGRSNEYSGYNKNEESHFGPYPRQRKNMNEIMYDMANGQQLKLYDQQIHHNAKVNAMHSPQPYDKFHLPNSRISHSLLASTPYVVPRTFTKTPQTAQTNIGSPQYMASPRTYNMLQLTQEQQLSNRVKINDNPLPPYNICSPGIIELKGSPSHTPSPMRLSPDTRSSPSISDDYQRRLESPALSTSSLSSFSHHKDMSSDTHSNISSTPESLDSQEEPMDLSTRKVMSDIGLKNDDSLLRVLLCRKGLNVRRLSTTSEESQSKISPDEQMSPNSPVTLAKKNLLPIGARVSDWLVKIIQFAISVPEFSTLTHNDKVVLILNCWEKLMLLFMAENNFHFVVTPKHQESSGERIREDFLPAPEVPTVRSSEAIQAFIGKCYNMNLDNEEFNLLRKKTLFNEGASGLEEPKLVETLGGCAQTRLQQHISATFQQHNDKMRYSKILMCLPLLYGINGKMLENLFCKHITGDMDMDVLLKEMLQKL